MPSQSDIDRQQQMLRALRRSLGVLLKQRAQQGVYTPPHVELGIEDKREELRAIKAALRSWGAIVEDLPDDGPADLPPALASEQAGAAIVALTSMLDSATVRTAAAGFREGFELICTQIDRLSTYKDLHDQLHDLQFNCYNPIARSAHDFPTSQYIVTNLEEYTFTLREIVTNLWELADRASLAMSEHSWIAQIEQAATLLQTTVEQASKPLLERAISQLSRVLYIHPARINERLKETARDLPLASLRKAITEVRQAALVGTPAVTLERLDQGSAAIAQIETQLRRLIKEHDGWQDLELELCRIEERLDSQLDELRWLWGDLPPRLAALAADREDRWMRELMQAQVRLDQALATDTAATIVAAFRPFRRHVGLCFFQADKRLKEFCRTLRRFDGPLQAAIEIML